MRNSLKTKLTLGTGFLVLLLALSAGWGIYAVLELRSASRRVLADNYASLRYVQAMQWALHTPPVALPVLDSLLQRQEANITERGEALATRHLRQELEQWRSAGMPAGGMAALERQMLVIQEINLEAIRRKNAMSDALAGRMLALLCGLAALLLLTALVFMRRFPARISRPILEKDIARTNFIATISHELKTPLASADIGLKLLERDANGLSAQQREIVADLKQDNQRLIRLVSELLDLSQAETGHLHLRMEAVPAHDLVTAAVGAIKQQAEAKSIRFETAFPENLPALYADREKAIWVMVNVLSNAVKFSPPGSVVAISAKIMENEVICTVQDQGPGIPEGMREQVFDRFFTRGGKGTGLGLYIARQFMEAMEGTISLESGPGTRVAMIFRRAA